MYSKSYILNNYETLNINRLVRENINRKPTAQQQDKQRRDSDLRLLKQRLLMQYL